MIKIVVKLPIIPYHIPTSPRLARNSFQTTVLVMSDDHEPENISSVADDVEDPTVGMNEMQKRLFNVRMRMNQGRKANQTEVQNEFKRFNDPKFDQRQRFDNAPKKDSKREPKRKTTGGDGGNDDTTTASTTTNDDRTSHTTVEAAERRQRKVEEKEKNMATCGLQALVTDRTYKSYTNQLSKLPSSSSSSSSRRGSSSSSSSSSSSNSGSGLDQASLLSYGQNAEHVSKEGRERLSAYLAEVDANKSKNSRRRMNLDSTDVDYINSGNETFNKKIKKSFDKYTVEIRQNLERGTAV